MRQRVEKLNFDQFDIGLILKDVLLEWWVILILAISAGLFTFVYVSSSYVPQYTSSSTFVVRTRGLNTSIYQDLNNATDVADRFRTVLNSTLLKKKVAQELGMENFNGTMTAKVVDQTNLIELKVTSDSPLHAYKAIRTVMDNYSEVSDYVIENVVLMVIQEPSIPLQPSNTYSPRRRMQRNALITAALAFVYFAFFSYIRDTVKNEHDIERKLAARLIGSIYHEQAGVRKKKTDEHKSMLITSPILSFRYVESCRMTASKLRSKMDRIGARVLLISSAAENEGKSTVAANMAIAMAQEGKNVVLMDCDFRKPSQYKIFEADEEQSRNMIRALNSGRIDDLAVRWHDTSLFLALNNKAVSSLEALRSGRLIKAIEHFRETMDYIILDTAPMTMVADTEELAQISDASVLVVREDSVLAKEINDTIDILNNTKAALLGCIYNDLTSRSSAHASYGYGSYYGRYGKYEYGGKQDGESE